MSKRHLRALPPTKEKSTLTILFIVLVLHIVLPIPCITLKMGVCMSFCAGTRGCRDGTNQCDRREMKNLKLVAHMKDGTKRDVPTLIDYEELRTSGLVMRFEKMVVL